jgi:hypothetical protein
MLTLDLLRYRIAGDVVTPTYINPTGGKKYLDAAEQVIDVYKAHDGKTLGELEEAIADRLGSTPDYKVYRGLAKMMESYIETAPAVKIDAEKLRAQVFSLAAQGGPLVRTSDLVWSKTISDRLSEISDEIGVSVDSINRGFFSDLRENQVTSLLDSSITPTQLIERYNTALAQAMLYRATRMIVDVYDSYRTVFKYIKLARLMHTVKSHDGGYRIEIDGPMSLFANVERYGIAMARLLPAVLKCAKWKLAAKTHVDGSEKLFRLMPGTGLKSHYRDEPEFNSSAEEAFFNKFAKNKKSKWTIEREGSVLDLKDTVMIPDFRFTHKDGRTAHLEIVGFWTPEYLRKKLDKLARAKETNIIVAVPESLNCSSDQFSGQVIRFKSRLLVKDVLPALDLVAITSTNPT